MEWIDGLITATLIRDNSNINSNVNEQHFEYVRPCSTFSTCCMFDLCSTLFDILDLLYVQPVFDIILSVTIGGLGSFWDLSGICLGLWTSSKKIPEKSQKSLKKVLKLFWPILAQGFQPWYRIGFNYTNRCIIWGIHIKIFIIHLSMQRECWNYWRKNQALKIKRRQLNWSLIRVKSSSITSIFLMTFAGRRWRWRM